MKNPTWSVLVILLIGCVSYSVMRAQSSEKPTAKIELQSFGEGATVQYGLRVSGSDADEAIVQVFYHGYIHGITSDSSLLLSETEVVPLINGATSAVGAFKWRARFLGVAWVDVTLVKTVQKKKFFDVQGSSGSVR
jgi:hypothetical protein